MAGYRRLMDEPDSSASQGDVYYADGSGDTARLSPGTDGHVLTTHGAAADPTWEAPGSGAPTDAQYLTLATHASLSDERVATAGSGISLTDAGAGSTATFALDIAGLTADDVALADSVPFRDDSGSDNNKSTIQRIGGFFNRQVAGGKLTLASGYPNYVPKRDLGAPSSTDTGADTVTFATAHGLVSGTKVAVSATAGGLTVATAYYINATSTTAISFHTTVAAALAASSKVNLTASITAEVYVIGMANRQVFYAVDESNLLPLYDGTRWNLYEFSELSLDISAFTADLPYDLWAYPNSGTPTLDSTAWSSTSARATALTTQDGVDVKTGDATRRFIGSICITGTTGDCEHSWGHPLVETVHVSMFVWNRYNKAACAGIISELASHNTNSTTYRQWRANAENRIDMMVGKAKDAVAVTMQAQLAQNVSNPRIGVGYDSTTVLRLGTQASNTSTQGVCVSTGLIETPMAGKHTFYPLQSSSAASNATHVNMFLWLHGHM